MKKVILSAFMVLFLSTISTAWIDDYPANVSGTYMQINYQDHYEGSIGVGFFGSGFNVWGETISRTGNSSWVYVSTSYGASDSQTGSPACGDAFCSTEIPNTSYFSYSVSGYHMIDDPTYGNLSCTTSITGTSSF